MDTILKCNGLIKKKNWKRQSEIYYIQYVY